MIMWASPASEKTDRRHFKAGACWVSITFGGRPRTPQSAHQLGVMVISFSSQHAPLVDFKDQPTCSVQQGLSPILKMGSQVTYEMQPTSRTTVVLRKLRVRQDRYILVQKRVTKTVVVMAEDTCIVYRMLVRAGPPPRAVLPPTH